MNENQKKGLNSKDVLINRLGMTLNDVLECWDLDGVSEKRAPVAENSKRLLEKTQQMMNESGYKQSIAKKDLSLTRLTEGLNDALECWQCDGTSLKREPVAKEAMTVINKARQVIADDKNNLTHFVSNKMDGKPDGQDILNDLDSEITPDAAKVLEGLNKNALDEENRPSANNILDSLENSSKKRNRP